MKKEYILVIDSGIGGLSTLSQIYKKVSANFIYFADNKNAPYGNHKKEEIFKFLDEIIKKTISKYKVVMVVLACNTATTSSIEKLRNKYKHIKFVGTEPAINLAIKSNYKNILCVATKATIKQKRLKTLKKRSFSNVKFLGLTNFASAIEDYFVCKNFWAYFVILKNLYQIAKKSRNFDCLVLGCTHYIFLDDKIRKFSNKPTFDGNTGVANQVLFWHAKITKNPANKPNVKFLFSNPNFAMLQIYKKIFYEILAKV